METRSIKFREYLPNGRPNKFHYWGFIDGQFIAPCNPKNQQSQFCGLLDKHGNEIYEGDILKVTGPWDDEDSNTKNIVVEYADEGGYVIEWSSGFCGGDADITILGWAANEGYTFEVIGNIYENPELLK